MKWSKLLPAFAALALIGSCAGDTSRSPARSAFYYGGPPQDAKAYSDFLIARFAAMTNDPEVAAAHYASAIDTAPGKSGIAERAVFASLLSGNFGEGVRLSRRALNVGSDAPLVRLTLAVDAVRQGRPKDAETYLEGMRSGPFNKMVGRGLVAWQMLKPGDSEAAEAYLSTFLSGDQQYDSAMHYMIGLMQVAAGEDAAALETFEGLWQSGARLAVGVDAHARLLVQAGDRERAAQILQTFRTDIGHNAALDHLRADIVAGRDVGVRRLTSEQGAALAVYVPAAALMSQTDDDLSAVYFVLALALDPDLQVARSLWAQSLENAGRWDEAIAVLSHIPEDSEYYATSRGQMAWVLRRTGRNQEALSVASSALKNTADRGLRVQLADLYRSLDKHSDAEKVLTRIIEDDAKAGKADWRVIFARGATYEAMDHWARAEADLKQALALQPNDAYLLNYLGYAYVDRGEHLDDALEMIRKAAALKPDSGFITDSLGWAYYKLGDYEQAVTYLEMAVALEPGDAKLNDHLGDAYWQADRKLEARFQWLRALKLDPSAPERGRIEVKLEQGPEEPVVRQAEAGLSQTQPFTKSNR